MYCAFPHAPPSAIRIHIHPPTHPSPSTQTTTTPHQVRLDECQRLLDKQRNASAWRQHAAHALDMELSSSDNDGGQRNVQRHEEEGGQTRAVRKHLLDKEELRGPGDEAQARALQVCFIMFHYVSLHAYTQPPWVYVACLHTPLFFRFTCVWCLCVPVYTSSPVYTLSYLYTQLHPQYNPHTHPSPSEQHSNSCTSASSNP